MGRIAGWTAILVLTIYLVAFGGSWYGLYSSTLRATSVVLALLTVGVWCATAWRKPGWRARSVFLPVLGLALASLTVSTVFSRYPRQSVEYVGYALILSALYLLLVRIMANPFLRIRMGGLATTLCLILSVAYIGRTVALWIDYWRAVGHLTIPPLRPAFENLLLGDPASIMTIIVLLYASGVAASWPASRRGAIGALALGILVAISVIVSGSRSGWVAVAVACLALVVVLLRVESPGHRLMDAARAALQSSRGRLAAGVAVIGAAAGAVLLGPGVLARFGAGGDDLRAAYVAAASRIFSEAPLLGTGPGTWVIQRVRYTVAPEPDYYIPHAHNIYAQTLAELGIVGAAVGLLAVAMAVWLIRAAVSSDDPARRRWGWAAFFVIVYLGVQQLLDFHANMPSILFAAALPFAWLDATAPAAPRFGRLGARVSLGQVPALLGILALVVACAGLLVSERAAATEATAVDLANEGEWGQAYGPARQAAAEDPSWAPYQLTLGLTAAYAGDHTAAAAAFRRAAEADDLPESWLNLAAEETLLGQVDAGRGDLVRASRLGLQRPGVAMAIGELASRLEAPALAQQAFSAAIANLPILAADPWWQLDPARSAAFPDILAAAIDGADPGKRWEIALAGGDPSAVRGLADGALDPAQAQIAGDIIDAWAGDPAAFDRALNACRASPTNTVFIDWCARLSVRFGRDDLAERFRTQSYLLLDEPTGPFFVTVSDRPIVGRSDQGSVASFYGTYTYRRSTPWNILDPSLIQLTTK